MLSQIQENEETNGKECPTKNESQARECAKESTHQDDENSEKETFTRIFFIGAIKSKEKQAFEIEERSQSFKVPKEEVNSQGGIIS
mmetsp:Transcript_7114/g.8190  ORF Transcript_7114/g.8190 Transcript_7114/m.8190 type:complete len:86 (+) Transcript_7114:539-796(+)